MIVLEWVQRVKDSNHTSIVAAFRSTLSYITKFTLHISTSVKSKTDAISNSPFPILIFMHIHTYLIFFPHSTNELQDNDKVFFFFFK